MVVFLALLLAVVPDGNEWQDSARLSLGKEAPSTLRAPADALDLSGVEAWRFNWARRPSERPVGFARPDYDVSSWPKVTVPCSWQAMGIRPSGERFGVPLYVNKTYSFTPAANGDCPPKVMGHELPADWTLSDADNPVGSYRRDFEIPADWLSDEVVIRLEGVESFYYLWINGAYVGFAKDSRSPSVFDITRFVKPGANTVAVEVYRYCDGSYLECQDAFRLSGILRPVRVYRRKRGDLKDVRFEAHPERKGVYDGDWILSFAADRPTTFKVYAKDGAEVPLESVADGQWRVKSPKLWSAEEPNLYRLVAEGHAFNLGFREIEITEPANPRDRTFLINGRPVKLKGVNSSEVDPVYGHHRPLATLRKDIELIKRGNFNHIRNSHCPQVDEFYDLCDEYGLYVMDEANIESHGMGYGAASLSHRPDWRAAHLERVQAMVKRNRNHPSIVIWSLGNEAGPGENFKACYDWVKANEPTRPVNYERNSHFADIGSRQYPSLYWIRETAAGRENVKYPFHINEFLHNLNNNAGGIKSFQDAIESSDRILGGAIWDFADQGLKAVDAKTGRTYYAFGGDFGERPTDGQGILDGIVHADRTVEPAYYEARHAYQPFDTRLGADGASLVVESKYFFRDSSAYDFRVNGQVLDLRPIQPRERRRIDLKTLVDAGVLRTNDYLLVEFVQRADEGLFEKGWVIASDQIAVPTAFRTECALSLAYVPPRTKAVLSETATERTFTAGNFRYAFSKRTGSLVSLRGGVECLREPVFLDVFRGPTGGDMHLSRAATSPICTWARHGFRTMRPTLKRMTDVTEVEGALRFATLVDWQGVRKEELVDVGHSAPKFVEVGAVDPNAPGYHVATEWKVFGDGSLAVTASFRQFGTPTEVPRLGYRFVFDVARTKVDYMARGPWDNYADRKDSAFVGTYSADSTDFLERYGRTCDCGNRMDVSAVRLHEIGLTFAGLGAPIPAMQVLPYSPTELTVNPHPELLPDPTKTELGLYAVQRGLGSGNCGPMPETEFRTEPSQTYTYSFLITPEATLETRTLNTASTVAAEISPDARTEPPKPSDWMCYPDDEKVILGGKAVLRTGRMFFTSETDFWRFAGDLPDVRPIQWLMVKPRRAANAAEKSPIVLFLNAGGNHEYLTDLTVPLTEGRLRNDTAAFVIDNRASELTRGQYASPNDAAYFPLAELIERGIAVVMACSADACPDTAAEAARDKQSIFNLWNTPDARRTDKPTVLDAWAWLLSRGLDWAATDPDLDATRAWAMGCGVRGAAARLAETRDGRFAPSASVPDFLRKLFQDNRSKDACESN